MCILCVIQSWSRQVATMLPWLVIPLIGLWALSQLLPPPFRFEITSPRLACLFVLLITLFWYEILMPQLSAWRLRRNARLRERKIFEAIEMQKLRKTATRRCRNCLSPYRDQNPGGGRFMCSYCGHVSRRPALDLPVPPGLGISNSGIIKDLVGKGGKLLNGKAWSEYGWICGHELLENGNWVSGSTAGKSSHWRKSGNGIFGGEEDCFAEKSYSGVVIFACRLLTSFFLSIRWLWRKIFRISSPGDESSSGVGKNAGLSKRGDNNFHESRVEKARRKAEEKRQARLEKELLEEEERKQREEVARLVEEQRRLRDEKLEAEKGHSKSSPSAKDKDGRKEAEKKRHDRRKDKDRGSSKSVSDPEELEKRAGKECEQSKGDQQKMSKDDGKGSNLETSLGHGTKNVSVNNFNRASSGNKYFDRMKGTFFSSSKAFTGGSFFGKGAKMPVTTAKETRFNSAVDQTYVSWPRRDSYPLEHVSGKSYMNEEKHVSRPALSEPQPLTTPKKSWHQLFTRSSSVPASSTLNVISRPNPKPQPDSRSQHVPSQLSSAQTFESPVSIGLTSPFILPTYTSVPTSTTSLGFSPAIEPMFPRIQEGSHEIIPEETELFEDPCYVPDPSSLLGPVSESR